MIASVSGRRSVTWCPGPAWSTVDRAAHGLDGALDHVHADAAAGQRRDGLRGREARVEQELVRSRDRSARRRRAISPCSSALARMRAVLRPPPSSFTVTSTCAPEWTAASSIRPCSRLAGGGAASRCPRCRGRWRCGSGAPADRPGARSWSCRARCPRPSVTNSIGLPRSRDEIVHQPAEAAEQRADRHHARAHRGVAQAGRRGARFPRRPILIERSALAAASCVSRAWAMTSSPTRSISSSSRSAWTRTVAMPRSSRLASAFRFRLRLLGFGSAWRRAARRQARRRLDRRRGHLGHRSRLLSRAGTAASAQALRPAQAARASASSRPGRT